MKNTLFAATLAIAAIFTASPCLADTAPIPDGQYWISLNHDQKTVAVEMSAMAFITGQARAYASDHHANAHIELFSRSSGYYIACLNEFYAQPHAENVPIGIAFETLHDGASLGDQAHAIREWSK